MCDNKLFISFNSHIDKGNCQLYYSHFVLLDPLVIFPSSLELSLITLEDFGLPGAAGESNSRRSRSTARLKRCRVQNLSPPAVTILHTHTHTNPEIRDAMSCCLSASPDRVRRPLGEDDRYIRLMSWRLKVSIPLNTFRKRSDAV